MKQSTWVITPVSLRSPWIYVALCCKWQAKQIQLQMKLVSFDVMTGYRGYTLQKNISAFIHKYGLNTTEFCEIQLNKFS